MQQGRAVHTLSLKTVFDQDSYVESSVIDIYYKCGSIGEAKKAFRSSSMHNLAASNAMMMGFVQHDFLEDAKKTIDHIIQSDVHIWQNLLSAWNIHGHVELGRVVASNLLEMHPENESAYVLLSNLYASVGMWNAVGRLRKEMKEKKILSRTILVLAGFKLVDQFITLWLMIPHILKVKKYMRSQ
ncbi:hypothetical protein Peur_057190 [Populus x canadensis]